MGKQCRVPSCRGKRPSLPHPAFTFHIIISSNKFVWKKLFSNICTEEGGERRAVPKDINHSSLLVLKRK